MRNGNRSLGVTLSEILVCQAIFLALMLSFTPFLTAQKKWLNVHDEAMSDRMMSNAAFDLVSTLIKQAGYIGCARLTNDFPLRGVLDATLTANNKIEVSDTNHLRIRSMGHPMVSVLRTNQHDIIIARDYAHDFKRDRVYLVADCKRAELFKIERIINEKNTTIIVIQGGLHNTYDPGSLLGQFQDVELYTDQSGLVYKDRDQPAKRVFDDIMFSSILLDEHDGLRHRLTSPSSVKRWENIDGVQLEVTWNHALHAQSETWYVPVGGGRHALY